MAHIGDLFHIWRWQSNPKYHIPLHWWGEPLLKARAKQSLDIPRLKWQQLLQQRGKHSILMFFSTATTSLHMSSATPSAAKQFKAWSNKPLHFFFFFKLKKQHQFQSLFYLKPLMVHVIPALYQPRHFHHSRCMTATFSQHDTAVCLAPTTPEKSCLHGHCAKAQQVQQLIQVSIKGQKHHWSLAIKREEGFKEGSQGCQPTDALQAPCSYS